MGTKKSKSVFKLLLILIVAVAILASILISLKNNSKINTLTNTNNQKYFTSNFLKISFKYSSLFFIKDLDYRILLTNYELTKNINYRPSSNEIEIQIYNHNKCQISLDEEIRIGNCFAEGNWIPTKVLDKKTEELAGGTLYTYTIKQPNGRQRNRYILIHGDKSLEITKDPNPSQFDKEFEDIINSIKFL